MILENMQKLFFIFTFFLPNAGAQAAPSSQACHKAFAVFELQKVFSDFESYTRYRGQEGYLLFVEQSPTNSMDYAFNKVSKALGENLKRLGWRGFQGSVEEFKNLRGRFLDSEGEIKEEYRGMEGYALFAEKHYGGGMSKAFQNASSVLTKEIFRKLWWQAFHGSVEEFHTLKQWLLDENGKIREKYRGMEGYALFAEEYYSGDMPKAFLNVSSVLGGFRNIREFGLDWKMLKCDVEQFHALVQLFENNKASNFQGPEGLKALADKIFKGHQGNTYKNVSALRDFLSMGTEGFKALNWPVIR